MPIIETICVSTNKHFCSGVQTGSIFGQQTNREDTGTIHIMTGRPWRGRCTHHDAIDSTVYPREVCSTQMEVHHLLPIYRKHHASVPPETRYALKAHPEYVSYLKHGKSTTIRPFKHFYYNIQPALRYLVDLGANGTLNTGRLDVQTSLALFYGWFSRSVGLGEGRH